MKKDVNKVLKKGGTTLYTAGFPGKTDAIGVNKTGTTKKRVERLMLLGSFNSSYSTTMVICVGFSLSSVCDLLYKRIFDVNIFRCT